MLRNLLFFIKYDHSDKLKRHIVEVSGQIDLLLKNFED